MARILLFGAGATGARIARQLRSTGLVEALEVRDSSEERLDDLTASFAGWVTRGVGRRIDAHYDAVVVATPPGSQVAVARRGVQAGVPVVTTSNQTSEVRRLLDVVRRPYDDATDIDGYGDRRPDWARTRVGCSQLSCSS